MNFGNVLIRRIEELHNVSINKKSADSFWIKLRNIAVEEINQVYPKKVDSNLAIEIYFSILSTHSENIPDYYKEKLKSNNQERFRVINRNLWSSNAFHKDGLANQKYIHAIKQTNRGRTGNKIIYVGDSSYVNSK